MKTCNKCKETKQYVDFYKSKIKKDGLQVYCKSCCNTSSKAYYELNKDKIMLNYERNKTQIIAKNTAYKNNRKKNDPVFRSVCNLRSRISKLCKAIGSGKKFKTMESIGLTQDEFKLYIESLFTDGMSWDNYGDWQVDHVKPLRTAKTEDDLFLLNHYSNLQPLWWTDNLAKSGKYDE